MTCGMRRCDPVIVDNLGIQLHCSCFELISSFDLGSTSLFGVAHVTLITPLQLFDMPSTIKKSLKEKEKQSLAVKS